MLNVLESSVEGGVEDVPGDVSFSDIIAIDTCCNCILPCVCVCVCVVGTRSNCILPCVCVCVCVLLGPGTVGGVQQYSE